jgi:putative transcriptional regulator
VKEKNIIARMTPEGVKRVLADGSLEDFPPEPATREMSDAQIEAAALSDPDAQPLTEERLRHLRRVPRVKTLRRALGLTQEEFAERYQIPVGTLRDWEQGRSEPDQPARSYLKVIARDPEHVRKALARAT